VYNFVYVFGGGGRAIIWKKQKVTETKNMAEYHLERFLRVFVSPKASVCNLPHSLSFVDIYPFFPKLLTVVIVTQHTNTDDIFISFLVSYPPHI